MEVTTGGATVLDVVAVWVVVTVARGLAVGVIKHEHALEMDDDA